MANKDYLIKDCCMVNEGQRTFGDLWIKNGRIEKMGGVITLPGSATEIDGSGQFLLPGAIDDQVHFREPGQIGRAHV